MVSLKPITKQNTKKILEQMENNFYRIKTNEGKIGIGFFCNIKIKNKYNPVLITDMDLIFENNHKEIEIFINNVYKKIEIGDSIHKIKECNIIIIEIKINQDIKINYLEIDDLLYKNEVELYYYYNEPIYLIYCNNLENISVSYDIIRDINNIELTYQNKIKSNYKYSLIFNLSNNKLIGIKKNISNNKGIFFNSIINRFIRKSEIIKNNEIEIIIKIDKTEDIGNQIYFLSNNYYDIEKNKYILCHEKLKELNTDNVEMYINKNKYEYNKFFIPSYKNKIKN